MAKHQKQLMFSGTFWRLEEVALIYLIYLIFWLRVVKSWRDLGAEDPFQRRLFFCEVGG